MASQFGRLDVLRYLVTEARFDLGCKAVDGSDALIAAARGGYEEIVKILLKNGADVNVADSLGWSALMHVSFQGRAIVARLLIERGANVHAKCHKSGTCLWVASCHGHLDVVKILVENGADVNSVQLGWTPLLSSIERAKSLQVAQYLVAHGADLAFKGENGITPFFLACQGGAVDIVEWLIQIGANDFSTVSDGRGPLSIAARFGHLAVMICCSIAVRN
jgi:ankyrin repeat protein